MAAGAIDQTRPGAPTSRMRVLEVSASRQVWGAELATMALARPLAERGIDLVLASPPGGDLVEHWQSLGLPHVPLELPARKGLRSADGEGRPSLPELWKELDSSWLSVRMIAGAARRFDMLRSSSLWSHLDCAVAGRLVRRPVVVELNDMIRPGVGRRVVTAAVRLSSLTIAVSTAVSDCVGPSGRSHVRVVPQAVDLKRFHPGPPDPEIRRWLTSDPDAPLVGIVGRIHPDKGVELLARAVAGLTGAGAHAHLVVVGSPGLAREGYLDAVVSEAGELLGDRVRFVGRSDDVPAVLRALDVLVNASAAEPFGLSVLEAQASGVAVVGTRAGGIPDFVSDGENGLLVTRDVRSLGEALERLLGSPRFRAKLAEGGSRSAQGRGIEARADALAQLFRSLVLRRRTASTPIVV